MDPFGNFGWNFGFGFGWIVTGIVAVLMVLAIVQLVRFSFQDVVSNPEDSTALEMLKQDICAGRLSLQEFEERIKSRA